MDVIIGNRIIAEFLGYTKEEGSYLWKLDSIKLIKYLRKYNLALPKAISDCKEVNGFEFDNDWNLLIGISNYLKSRDMNLFFFCQINKGILDFDKEKAFNNIVNFIKSYKK